MIAASFNRTALSTVLLQGQAEPGYSILPEWLSAYATLVAPAARSSSSLASAARLSIGQRQVLLRIDPSDAIAQAIAERLAVDAREAGFTITLQAPVGLAPRPDARLVRIRLPAITLTLDLDEACRALRADGEQLGRVVQNLLLNAVDASLAAAT
jgi:signal transduction histidine kinase